MGLYVGPTPVKPHPVPLRHYRAWRRECVTCGHVILSALLLTIHVSCPNGCGTMAQSEQGAVPDIDTVTEWGTCGVDAVCPDHR